MFPTASVPLIARVKFIVIVSNRAVKIATNDIKDAKVAKSVAVRLVASRS